MYAIKNQENKKQIEHIGYQLFEQINLTCLMCDVNEIKQIIFWMNYLILKLNKAIN